MTEYAVPTQVALTRSRFKAALQRGVGVTGRAGASVRDFLVEDLGLDPSYVDGELGTAMLDNQPLDDFGAAQIRDGCVLALSAAMPGLAGATLRRGGYYARMRDGISRANPARIADGPETCVVTLKLFNKPLADLVDRLAGKPLRMPGAGGADWATVRLTQG
jgi:hypothetical protein